MKVPLADLGPTHAECAEEALAAVAAVVRSGRFVLGEPVARFERTVAGIVGVEHAVGVASGTDALVLALRACGVGEGDLVLTTPLTFVATAEAIVRAGARPIFCDVSEGTLTLDPHAVRRRIAALAGERGNLRAIVPVHLFGRACDMRALGELAREHGLAMVEDCAQALGARDHGGAVGSFGAAGCLSFFPSKNLGAWGDGGAIVTRDPEIARRARRLRAHGGEGGEGGRFVEIGYNSRLDALQAAVLDAKAPRLAAWTASRVLAAERYRALLAPLAADVRLPSFGAEGAHVFHQFVVRARARDELAAHLAAAGIASRAYYATPLHREPCFAALDAPDLPVAEAASAELLALPMFYGITEAQQAYVASNVGAFFARAVQ